MTMPRIHYVNPVVCLHADTSEFRTDDPDLATCEICRDHIARYDLRPRWEFSEPIFIEVAATETYRRRDGSIGVYLEGFCPVCGTPLCHDGELDQPGAADGPRHSQCNCWEYYHITEITRSHSLVRRDRTLPKPSKDWSNR